MDRDDSRSAFSGRCTTRGRARLSLESELDGNGVVKSVDEEAEAGDGCSGVVLSIDVMGR